MSLKKIAAIGVLTGGAVYLLLAQTPVGISGQWTIGGPVVKDQVELTIRRSSPGSDMSSSSALPLSQLRGLTLAQLNSAGTVVRFEIVRDAGTFRLEGFVQKGGGGGNFTFAPNANYASEMRSLGYSGINDERSFALAVHDVSLQYIRDLHGLGIRPESTDKLLAMRIHGVSIEYVKEMKALGYSDLTPDKLVTMRIHGVSVEFARELKSMGYASVSPDQMVTMRIHGASTDFIKEVAALGYDHPSVDQLVTMRIHGVSPEFIRKTRSLGMGNLAIDQLVSLRIHGVVE